jgi:hypothetical protein
MGRKYIFIPKRVDGFNTEIGGVSADYSTAALLATALGISSTRISNFTIVGSDIKCRISGGSYAIPSSAFQFNRTPCTYYRDTDYLVTSIGSNAFYATNAFIGYDADFQNCLTVGTSAFHSNSIGGTERILLKNATTINNTAFALNINTKLIYIPSVTSLGTTSGNNSVFQGSRVGLVIYAHPSLATNNAGAPDGDLTDAISRGATVRYVTNFTAPVTPTIASIGTIYNTAIQLVDEGVSTNAIDYFKVYIGGVFYQNVYANSYITGLTPSTAYSDIALIAVDVFLNKSVISTNLSASTNTTNGFPTTGLVSLYNFDEISGTVLNDSYGSQHLTNTGITINQSGLIDKSYISTASNQSLYSTATTPITGNFSINIWVYRTGNPTGNNNTIVEQGQHSSAGFGLWMGNTNLVTWRVNGTFNNYSNITVVPLNQWCMLTLTWDGTYIKVYRNAIMTIKTSWTTTPVSSPNRRMFNRSTNSEAFIGNLDLCAFYNVALTQADIDLLYNSGTGITL